MDTDLIDVSWYANSSKDVNSVADSIPGYNAINEVLDAYSLKTDFVTFHRTLSSKTAGE
jgi:hypothetical protein